MFVDHQIHVLYTNWNVNFTWEQFTGIGKRLRIMYSFLNISSKINKDFDWNESLNTMFNNSKTANTPVNLDYIITLILITLLGLYVLKAKVNMFMNNARLTIFLFVLNYLIYCLYDNIMNYQHIYYTAAKC